MAPGRAAAARADARRGRGRTAARDAHVAGRQRDGRPARGRVRLDEGEGRRADAPGRGGGGDADVPRPAAAALQGRARPVQRDAVRARRRRRTRASDVRQALAFLQPEAGTAIGDSLALATRLVQRSHRGGRRGRRDEGSARRDRAPLRRQRRRTACASRGRARSSRGAPASRSTRSRSERRGRRAYIPGPGNVLIPVFPDPELMRAIAAQTNGKTFTATTAEAAQRRLRRPQREHRPRAAKPRDHVVVRLRRGRAPACSRRARPPARRRGLRLSRRSRRPRAGRRLHAASDYRLRSTVSMLVRTSQPNARSVPLPPLQLSLLPGVGSTPGPAPTF